MPIIRFPTGGYDPVSTVRSMGHSIPGLSYFPGGGYDPVATIRAQGTGSGTSGAAGGGFNLNPQPTTGNGPFGAVPGQLGLPDPAGDLGRQIPNLPKLNQAASGSILAKLTGQLSPGTLNALKNSSAQFGVSSGMPGSELSTNRFFGNVAGAAEAQQQSGIQDLNSLTSATSNTQTVNPALQNEIATQNSLNAAAPDPTQSASYAQSLFDKYLQSMRGPGGGTGGRGPQSGTVAPSAPPTSQYRQPSASPVYSPSGPSSFGGSSSQFESDYPPEWDLPLSQPQSSYGVLAPEFDSSYSQYGGMPDYDFDYFDF